MATHPNTELVLVRKQHAWSQEEVAEKIGTTQANLSRWERGLTSPTPYYARKLCELYQKSPEELFPSMFEHLSASSTQEAIARNAATIFHYNMALDNTHEFYGREREKLRLLSRTSRGESTSIVGSRRIGKTWLLQYLRLIAPTQLGKQFIIGYVDATAPSCATLSGFTTEMLAALNIPPSADSSMNLITLQSKIKEFKENNQVPILCIDEFEGVHKIIGPNYLEFLEHLRAIAQEGLGLVLASKKPLIDVVAGGETSPFFNIFMQILLKPFTRQEAEAFIRDKSKDAVFTEQECDRLLMYAKQDDQELWPPLRLQLVGTLLQEDKLLASQGEYNLYRPDTADYWQEFVERVEEIYQGAIR